MSAPLVAQYLAGVFTRLPDLAREDIRAGRINSRRVRRALAHVATCAEIPLYPSRRELAYAARFLAAHDWEAAL